jgi:hypothetical protein
MANYRKFVVGHKQGRLTVIEIDRPNKLVTVQCGCGNRKLLSLSAAYRAQSCGCLKGGAGKLTSQALAEIGVGSLHPAYRAWQYHQPKYPDSEFRTFEEFWTTMGPTWFEGARLKVLIRARGLSPGNVKWLSKGEMARVDEPKSPFPPGERVGKLTYVTEEGHVLIAKCDCGGYALTDRPTWESRTIQHCRHCMGANLDLVALWTAQQWHPGWKHLPAMQSFAEWVKMIQSNPNYLPSLLPVRIRDSEGWTPENLGFKLPSDTSRVLDLSGFLLDR